MILKVQHFISSVSIHTQIYLSILTSFTERILCNIFRQAAYNVGGQSVNAQTIQNSILGCQSHRPSLVRTYAKYGTSLDNKKTQAVIRKCRSNKLMRTAFQWVRALFTPTKRSGAGTARHPYALHHPEPVAHFALSTGAFSDPPVSSLIIASSEPVA